MCLPGKLNLLEKIQNEGKTSYVGRFKLHIFDH